MNNAGTPLHRKVFQRLGSLIPRPKDSEIPSLKGVKPLPDVHQSPHVAATRIHITVKKTNDGVDSLVSALTDDDEVVLKIENQTKGVELKGQARINNADHHDEAGIYLHATDFAKYTTGKKVTVHRYTKADTREKMSTTTGWLLFGTALMTILTAAVGVLSIFFAIPNGATSAQTAQSIVAWTQDPADQLNTPNLAPPQLGQIHQSIQSRGVIAQQCLQARDGHPPATPIAIPGVDCSKPPLWRTTRTYGIATAIFAVVTGVLGAATTLGKFGFQQAAKP
jgi:hypothetical protein